MKGISINDLAKAINTESSNILILDVRDVQKFNEGSIVSAINVFCCGALILRRLKKGNTSVESLLSCEEDKQKFNTARDNETVKVVVYDQDSTDSTAVKADSLSAILLKKLSREVKNVCFLEGGYSAFSSSHSSLCVVTDSQSRSNTPMLQNRPSSLVLQLQGLTVVDSDSESSESDDSEPSSPVQSRIPMPFEILPHLYLSCRKGASNKQSLEANNISRILNVTNEASEYQHLEGFTYHQIAVEDKHEVNMLECLPRAFSFIEEAKLANEKVLVHCHAGMSRSVTVVLAYLMKFEGLTLNNAYDFVKQKKSNISPNFSFMEQLVQFENSLRPSPSDSGIGSNCTTPLEGSHCSMNVFSTTNLPSPNYVCRCILAA